MKASDLINILLKLDPHAPVVIFDRDTQKYIDVAGAREVVASGLGEPDVRRAIEIKTEESYS
ncbi:MAG: hypothetical protein GC182_09000 [Rhodopseudomonas sp.]|nr:hypothetical protein [Rhodopseudomonas sp.]